MSAIEKRTFSLPAEQAAFIDQLVRSGVYATSSEVIRAGLRALQERDAAVERWLREEVIPTYDSWKADPGKGISSEEMAERAASAMMPIRRRSRETSSRHLHTRCRQRSRSYLQWHCGSQQRHHG